MTTFNTELLEALAADIGREVYLDVAKWHLYLRDAHLHTALAEQLYPLLSDRQLSEDRVTQILQTVSVKIGGGKRELPLLDLMPMQGLMALMDILETYQQKL